MKGAEYVRKEIIHDGKDKWRREGNCRKNLLEYLKDAGFQPEQIVVERNLEIIPREQLGNVMIQDEDVIEVLSFVGGG